MQPDFPTLRSALGRAATLAPSRGITILDGRGRSRQRRFYPDVLARAVQIAHCWQAAGITRGDRVLIALPTSWDWVDSWLGALLVGAIPATASPGGGLGSATADICRIADLADGINARFVLVSRSFREETFALELDAFADRAITFEELAAFPGSAPLPDDNYSAPIAFLQFTSGTEGFPRAVEISDRAALHNVFALNEAILSPREDRQIDTVVSWLPLYHDMGLVGAFLHAIATGRELVLMPSRAFLARPFQWLREIASPGSALSFSPTFGFRYCANRLPPGSIRDLNLGGWLAAVCGAETIYRQTVEEFAATFACAGFRTQAFRAGYGLAEATLAVTLDQKGKGARTMPARAENGRNGQAHEVICLGEPLVDTEIRCAGPDGADRPEGETGEILVRGPGLFSGYFGDANATQAAFRDGWLLTGDMGFIHSGELYLTGRLKDLLIIRGENLMPHQLEGMAEAICGGTCRAVAFSVETAQDGGLAVLLVETTEQDQQRITALATQIRARIGEAFGLQLADLVFLRRERLPTSTSGKLRRSEAKEQYLAGRWHRT